MRVGYVTGGTGCVGRNLVDELLRAKWEVVVLHRRSSDLSRLKGCKVRFQEVDLHDSASTLNSLQADADAIFHVAANTSHWPTQREQQYKDNVVATRNLVQASLAKGAKRFIFTSTGATLPYQGADERLANEIDIGYVRTKRLSELEVYKGAGEGLYAVILHPIIVIGAYDYHNYSRIFTQLKSGKMKAALPGRIAFCHAADVARAHVQAFERGRCLESYVLGGTYTTWLDAFQRIAKTVGAPPPTKILRLRSLKVTSYAMWIASMVTGKEPQLTPELVRLLRDAPDVSFCDKRKAKEELGYESRDLDTMVKDCYDWLVKEGRI
jgi:nucleoside-diphosphate-sugar epimerase